MGFVNEEVAYMNTWYTLCLVNFDVRRGARTPPRAALCANCAEESKPSSGDNRILVRTARGAQHIVGACRAC